MADLTNPFDLLGDTDENAEPNIEQLAAANAKAAAPKKEEAKAAVKAPAAKPDAGRGARGGRGGDVRGRGAPGRGRLGAPRAESGEVAENGYDAGAPAAYGRGGRGEMRGRGGRGEGRGRGAGRGSYDSGRPRREFDRHDGTGRGYEGSKRGGGGRGNWGADDGSADAPAAEEAPVAEEAVEKPEGEAAEEPAAEEVAPVEEEVKEMSLDEYEAMLAEKKAALNKKASTRTVDISEFANLKAVNKDEEEEENPLEVTTSKEKKGPRAKELKAKEVLQANFKVASESAGFGERRGRGERGGRGGRGRGGFGGRGGDRPERTERPFAGRGAGRGPSGPGAAINVEDTSAFPSLG